MTPAAPTLQLRMLGTLAVLQDGAAVDLPRSRKVRALLAYLALAGRPVTRSHLCELLWDLPSDPRGELRWSLSKLRGVVDAPGRARVITDGNLVALDIADADVDVLAVLAAVAQGIAGLPQDRLAQLASLLGTGELLDGLDLPRSPAFTGWLLAERRRLRAAHVAVLEHWVRALPPAADASLAALERWLQLAPFDRHAHERMLDALAARGRLREGDEHLAAAARQYDAEGQDWAPIGTAWRLAKERHAAGRLPSVATPPAREAELATPAASRASLAVMPFADRTPGVALRGGFGDGIAHDIITRLSKLRSMFVIAPGTVFALSERRVDSEDAGRRLDVDYVAGGWVRRSDDGRLRVNVQLQDTRGAQVLWAEDFEVGLDDAFAMLDVIGDRIVAAIANQVEVAERNRAVLKNPNSLNAWEAYHRGLWHMVRFNRDDNEQARHFFQTAVRTDPTFARPHAGLSFTHFQDAFLGWGDPATAIERAYRTAADGLMADERDPAAHWALGRAMWLQDRQDDALRELQSSVELSPNFALGHYTLAFIHAQSGDPVTAMVASDQARALSPMDPLLFGMLASRALAMLRLGLYEEAADWAMRAGARPNAHVHISAVAMICLALAGRTREARDVAADIQRRQPGYAIGDFVRAFKMGADGEALVQQAVRAIDG